MTLPLHSQTSSTKQRVQSVINESGDTLIQMKLSDAKIILGVILDKEISDSLLKKYYTLNNVKSTIISFQVKEIKFLQQKYNNQETLYKNLQLVLSNKNEEIELLNETIKKQKKEIRKQKILKIIGFSGSVILPVATLAIILGIKK